MSKGTDATHVDDLISGLGAAGAVDSVGGFTLDRDKAREKMRQFQLAEPHRYVLELVQAAVLKGATRIDFHIDADDMRMTFDGRPFTTDDFDALYSSLFARVRNPQNDARQHLAVGLNAAMALNPRYVRVDSGTGKERLRLELRPEQEDRFEAREADAGAPTVIHVKARFRPGLVVAFYRDRKGTIPEEKLLRTHCARARTQIYLDDVAINRGYDLPGAVAVQPLEGKGVSGLVGFQLKGTPGASIEWIKHGVWITTHDFHPDRDRAWVDALGLNTYYGFEAVVEADALRMDFSRQDIVWDDAYTDVLAVLRKARDEAVKEICGWRRSGISEGWARALLKRVTAQLTPEELSSADDDQLGPTVARANLWSTLTGDLVSLLRIRTEVQEHGALGFSFTAFTNHDGDPELDPQRLAGGRLVLHLADEWEETLLRRLLNDRLRLVTNYLQARKEAIQSYRRFRRRQMQVALPPEVDYLATLTLTAQGLTGALGLRQDQKPSRLTLVREGCLLVQINCKRSLPGLEMVLAGDFTPNSSYTNMEPDAVYGQAIRLVLEHLEALYANASVVASMNAPLRRQLLAYLVATMAPGFSERFLRAWGAVSHVPDPPQVQVFLGVGESPLPPGSAAPHPLASAPLISDVTARWWSLDELAMQLKQLGSLPWVSGDMPLQRNYDRLLLHLNTHEKAVLDRVFGDALRSDVTDYQQALRLAAHRKKPRLELESTQPSPLGYQVGFECGTTRGRLTFQPVDVARTRRTSTLRLLYEHRELRTYDLDLGLPAFDAVVNDDTFLPNAQWTGLRDPTQEQRCQRLVYQAAVVLLDHLAETVPWLPEETRAAVQWLLRQALSALVPHALFGAALRWLLSNDPSPWRHYLELVSLTAWVPTESLVSALNALNQTRIPPTAEALWAQLSLAGSLPEPLPALKADLPSFTHLVGTPPPGAPHLPLIQKLAELPMFRTLEGEWVTLAALRERSATETLPYLMENADAWLLADHLVLHTPGPDRKDLLRLLGPSALMDGRPLLEARRKVAEFESRRESSLRLLPGTTLVQRGLKAEEIVGEVGLAAEPDEGNWVLLHKDRRYICRQGGVFSQALVAVVSSSDLCLTEDFRDVVPDAARARALAACEDRLPALIPMLLHGWTSQSDAQREAAYDHLLAFLGGAARPQWRGEQPTSELVTTLSRLSWLPGVAEQRYSLDDMRAEVAEHGELVYLSAPLAGGSNRRVLILAGRRLGLIQRLFDRVRDYSNEWEEAHLREILGLTDAPVLQPHRREDELVGARCQGAGFEGRLYLPRSAAEPLVLRFSVNDLELHRETLCDFAPCAGRLETSRTTYRQSGGRVVLGAHDRYNLQTACYRLYRSLCGRYIQGEDPADKLQMQSLLRSVALELHARLQGRSVTLEDRWTRLYGLLAELPLLELPGEGQMSVTAALERRPPELATLGLWSEQLLAAPPAPVKPHPSPPEPPAFWATGSGDSLDQHFAVPNLPIPTKERQLRKRQPDKAVVSAEPTPERSAAPPPETPTARLARELRRAFERLGQGVTLHPQTAAGHLEVARHLERGLRLTAGQSGDAVRCDDHGLMLFRDHPLVQAAQARAEEDPLLLSLLLSAVYTAVNLHLEQVTDDHENAFLEALAAGVQADLGAPTPAQDLRIPPGEVT